MGTLRNAVMQEMNGIQVMKDKAGEIPVLYIAAARIDLRIVRIGPIITTSHWMRPGMHHIGNPEECEVT